MSAQKDTERSYEGEKRELVYKNNEMKSMTQREMLAEGEPRELKDGRERMDRQT